MNIPELFCSFPQRYCNELLRVIDGRFIAATEKIYLFWFFQKNSRNLVNANATTQACKNVN